MESGIENKVYVLYEFVDTKALGIGKLCSVYILKISEDLGDAIILLDSWIKNKKQLTIRSVRGQILLNAGRKYFHDFLPSNFTKQRLIPIINKITKNHEYSFFPDTTSRNGGCENVNKSRVLVVKPK
jgi:hypothetical protein